MADDVITFQDRALLQLLRVAAERRGGPLNLSATDYLIGILEGQFPPFSMEELQVEGATEDAGLAGRN